MRSIISEKVAWVSMLIILLSVIIFHGLVLAGVIPFTIVWGGRLESTSDMIRFETVSILINVVMVFIVGIRMGYINIGINPKIIRAILWIMTALFLLNTIGNLFSTSVIEKIVFTPITLLLSIFSWRLALR
jgi:hypothetical protein